MCNSCFTVSQKTTEFIGKANNTHGVGKWGYNKTVYKNNKTPVTITCAKHGDFQQRPESHLKGHGCAQCGGTQTKSTQDFILQVNLVHNDAYTYAKVVYKNNKTPVTITCAKHGDFQQTPKEHLRGAGCPQCASTTKSTQDFILQANLIHNDACTYAKVVYKNNKTPVIITCAKHGDFQQRPRDHLRGKGCPQCGVESKTKSTQDFILQANLVHNDAYTYAKVVYKNNKTPVIITCAKHGDFQQRPNTHLSGAGCLQCSGKQTKSTQDFILQANLIHNDAYTYAKVVYKNNKTPVIITCAKHGDFQQRPNTHLSGAGCPQCSNNVSKVETIWLDIIGVPERTKSLKLSNGKRTSVDGYDPKTNTVFEFHGDFWHGNPTMFDPSHINKITKKTFGQLYQETLNKENLIRQDGYNLVTIWEKEFYEQYKDKILELKNSKNIELEPYDILFS